MAREQISSGVNFTANLCFIQIASSRFSRRRKITFAYFMQNSFLEKVGWSFNREELLIKLKCRFAGYVRNRIEIKFRNDSRFNWHNAPDLAMSWLHVESLFEGFQRSLIEFLLIQPKSLSKLLLLSSRNTRQTANNFIMNWNSRDLIWNISNLWMTELEWTDSTTTPTTLLKVTARVATLEKKEVKFP